MFRRLLLKLATENIFIFNGRFYQQTYGYTIQFNHGPLSLVFANICMTKLEEDVVRPINTHFYKRFVDDSINRRDKNKPDELFNKLNSYYPKIKITIEITLEKILDTKIICKKNIQTSV